MMDGDEMAMKHLCGIGLAWLGNSLHVWCLRSLAAAWRREPTAHVYRRPWHSRFSTFG